MTFTMFDSIYVAQIPATGMDAVAGYIGGKWPTFAELVKRFPNLPALSIAVTSQQDGQCLDVETGDATPALVPGWLDRQAQLHPDRTPIIYCSASWIPAVRTNAGGRKYLLWSAHYGKGPHICSPTVCGYQRADATQWTDKGPNGETVDQTVMTPEFLAAFAPKPTQAASDVPPVFTKPPAPAPKPVPKPPAPAPAVLKVGSKGAAVQRLQIGLNRVFPAYSHLKVDGNYGAQTAAVIREFQRRTWHTPSACDGVVGPNTRAALARSGITF